MRKVDWDTYDLILNCMKEHIPKKCVLCYLSDSNIQDADKGQVFRNRCLVIRIRNRYVIVKTINQFIQIKKFLSNNYLKLIIFNKTQGWI